MYTYIFVKYFAIRIRKYLKHNCTLFFINKIYTYFIYLDTFLFFLYSVLKYKIIQENMT